MDCTSPRLVENLNAPLCKALLYGSGALLVLAALYFIVLSLRRRHRVSLQRKLLLPALMLLATVFLNRLAVGMSIITDDGIGGLDNVLLEMGNSLLHTFQTFSLDESYTAYLTGGMFLVEQLWSSAWRTDLYAYISIIQSVLCAFTSAGVLLTVLSRIFPRLKLWIKCLAVWKPICYFSAINQESLALAKSIRAGDRKTKNAILVFCDVSEDNEDAVTSELKEQALNLGAICLKDDLPALPFPRRNGKRFFLMDSKEEENLQALSAFTTGKRRTRLSKEDEIYIFSEDDSAMPVVKMVQDSVRAHLKSRTPRIKNINKYQTLVYELLSNTPLYTAVQPEDRDLHVVIFGSGLIGMEMLLATYWCGQMLYKRRDGKLDERDLHITVVSKDDKEDFIKKLNSINNDILNTVSGPLLQDKNKQEELLKIRDNKDIFASTYCRLDYVQADTRRVDMFNLLKKHGLFAADYFAVTLGSDEENLEMAELIARCVTIQGEKAKCFEASDKVGKKKNLHRSKVPIACTIYNDDLTNALEELYGEKSRRSADRPDDLYRARIVPFGSLDDTYNYRHLLKQRDDALRIHDAYRNIIVEKQGNESRYLKDMYAYWSDVARAIHIRYKAFSAGCASVEEYREKALRQDGFDKSTIDLLAWLEQRRWNAFMRTRGFHCPNKEQEEYYFNLPGRDKDGAHKSLALRLHPCIVERDKNGMVEGVLERTQEDSSLDCLDNCTIRWHKRLGDASYDFKTYDEPKHDFV